MNEELVKAIHEQTKVLKNLNQSVQCLVSVVSALAIQLGAEVEDESGVGGAPKSPTPYLDGTPQ